MRYGRWWPVIVALVGSLSGCDSEAPSTSAPPDTGQVDAASEMPTVPLPTTANKTAEQFVGELGVPPEPIERPKMTTPCAAAQGCVVAPEPDGTSG